MVNPYNIAQSTIPNQFLLVETPIRGLESLETSLITPKHPQPHQGTCGYQFEAIPTLNQSGGYRRYFIHPSTNEIRERSLKSW